MPALESMTAGDLLLAVLGALFIAWGWMRGVPRRIMSLLATLVSIVIAAQFRNPIGNYLGANWTDTPRSYGYLVAFALVFTAFLAAIAWFIEWRLPQYELFPRAPIVEKTLAAALAAVQALVLLGAAAMMLDPYFDADGARVTGATEFGPFRTVDEILRGSLIMGFVREDVVPTLLDPARSLFPRDLEKTFPTNAEPSPAPTSAPSTAPDVAPSRSAG